MIIGTWIAMGILSVAIVLGLVRVVTAPDNATRAVVGDPPSAYLR